MAHSDMSFDAAESTDHHISLDDMNDADDSTDNQAQERQIILHQLQFYYQHKKQSFFFFCFVEYTVIILN